MTRGGWTRAKVAGAWQQHGRPPVLTGGVDGDGFMLGISPLNTDTVGCIAKDTLPVWSGETVIDGTTGTAPHRVIENCVMPRPVRTGGGKVRYRNVFFTNLDGVAPTSATALLNNQSPDVEDVIVERCEFDPGVAGAHHNLNAVSGHHTLLHRSRGRRVVDFFGSFNPHGPISANRMTACVVEWLCYFYSPTLGVVHPSDYRTHNDGVQHQGGGGLIDPDTGEQITPGLEVDYCDLRGYVFYKDGVTVPTDQGQPAWEFLAHQGILCQQNVHPGTAINPVVRRTRMRGWQQALVFKTDDGPRTPYDAILEGMLFEVDDQRKRGTSADFYGVAGGMPFIVRLDRGTTVNGVQYGYPLPAVNTSSDAGAASSAEYQIQGGNNRYANTALVRPEHRGQLLTLRRDNFYGG